MRKRLIFKKSIPVLAALLAGLVLPGCSGLGARNLSFETIAQESANSLITGRNWENQSGFFVITGPEEVNSPQLDIPELQFRFPAALAEQLHALDYHRSFAVVVFRWLGATSDKYTVDILQVARDGENVVLKAHFGKPGQELTLAAFSSPFHIIAVSKEGEWAQDIRFVLKVDGQVVKERTYFIP